MPLKLLWQPRHAREVDVPYLLEIVDYDRRWAFSGPAFARWVMMETRRFIWRRREDE
jgi:hypothetical protein